MGTKHKHRILSKLSSLILSLAIVFSSLALPDTTITAEASSFNGSSVSYKGTSGDFRAHLTFDLPLVGQYKTGYIISIVEISNGKSLTSAYVNWGESLSGVNYTYCISRFTKSAPSKKYTSAYAIKNYVSGLPACMTSNGSGTASEIKSVLSSSDGEHKKAVTLIQSLFGDSYVDGFKNEKYCITLESVGIIYPQCGPLCGETLACSSYGYAKFVSQANNGLSAWKSLNSSALQTMAKALKSWYVNKFGSAGLVGVTSDVWEEWAVTSMKKTQGLYSTSTGKRINYKTNNGYTYEYEFDKNHDQGWVVNGINANYLSSKASDWGYLVKLASSGSVNLNNMRNYGLGCVAMKISDTGEEPAEGVVHTLNPDLSSDEQAQPHKSEDPDDDDQKGSITVQKVYVTKKGTSTYITDDIFVQAGCVNKVVIEDEPGEYHLKKYITEDSGDPYQTYESIINKSGETPTGTDEAKVEVPDNKTLIVLYVRSEDEEPEDVTPPVTSTRYNFILFENQMVRVIKLSDAGNDSGVDINAVALQMTNLSENGKNMNDIINEKFNFYSTAHNYSGEGYHSYCSWQWLHHYMHYNSWEVYYHHEYDTDGDGEIDKVDEGYNPASDNHSMSETAATTTVEVKMKWEDYLGDLCVAGDFTNGTNNPVVSINNLNSSSLPIYKNWDRKASKQYGEADTVKDRTGYNAALLIWRSQEADKLHFINYRTDEVPSTLISSLFSAGANSENRDGGTRTTAVPYRTQYDAKFNFATNSSLAYSRSTQNVTIYMADTWKYQSGEKSGRTLTLTATECANYIAPDPSRPCTGYQTGDRNWSHSDSYVSTDGAKTTGDPTTRRAYQLTSSLVYNGIRVQVQTYCGIPDNELATKNLSNDAGKVDAGSISFVPYIYMYYGDSLTPQDNPLSNISTGETVNTQLADKISQGTQARFRSSGYSKGAWLLCAVGGKYTREINTRHDALTWYNLASNPNLALHSTEWVSDAEFRAAWGTNSGLKGGSTLSIISGNNVSSSTSYLNRDVEVVHTKSWDSILIGDGLTQVNATGSHNMETTPDNAINYHDALSAYVQEKIDASALQLWVTGVDNSLIGTNNDAKPFETGQAVYRDTTQESALRAYTNSSTTSSEEKYYFDQDPVVGTVANSSTSGTIDLIQSTKTIKYYTCYTRNGQVYIDDTTSNPGVLTFTNSGASLASEIDQHTGVITQLKNNIQHNGGLDASSSQWYHECFDGITVVIQETITTWDLHSTNERTTIIDPKLTPSQGQSSNLSTGTGKDSMFAKYTAGAFKINLNDTENWENWRVSFSTTGSDKGWSMLFYSNVFYIPASTVQDNY